MKKEKVYHKNKSYSQNQTFFLMDQSMSSLEKNSHFFSQMSNFDSNDHQQSKEDILDFTFSQTAEFGFKRQNSLCCKTFFTQNQIIPQPESIIYEFKCYTFPFSKTKNDMLKKTVCAFLNAQGGHIFIGIQQNNQTKEHRVRGRVYNQAQKQQLLKVMRKNIESIQPDIVFNNKMEIRFVPVKNSQYPYHYLLGRYVVRIKIYPGIRDQVYTLKTDEGEYLVCVRTQNQVLTYDFRKQPRKLLSIQKQRAQNHNQFHNIQRHECKRPEDGARLFRLTHKTKTSEKTNICSKQSEQQKKQLNILIRSRKRQQASKDEKKSGQLYKENSKSTKSLSQSRSLDENNNKKSRRINKKQRKKIKKEQKEWGKNRDSSQINRNMESPQRSPSFSSEVRKQQIKKSCFRIIQSYYNAQKTKENKVSGIKQPNNCKQQTDKQRRFGSSPNSPVLEIQQKKARNRQRINKKYFQSKIYYLSKHFKDINYPFNQNNQLKQLNVKCLISHLLSTNHSSHRFFVFEGFSARRTTIIIEEFIKIGQDRFLQFHDLLLYQFKKETNELLIKNTLSKVIHLQKKGKEIQDRGNFRSMTKTVQGQVTPIVYSNTKKKRDKLKKSMNFNLQQVEYQNSFQSSYGGEQFFEDRRGIEDKESKDRNRNKNINKEMKRIFKLSTKLKIQEYNKLTEEMRIKLKETIKLIEQLCQKKNLFEQIFGKQQQIIKKQVKVKKQRLSYKQQEDQLLSEQQQLPKYKQINFINLYYSLLVYLELRPYHIDITLG